MAMVRDALQLFVKRVEHRSVLTAEERDALLALPGTVQSFRANHDIVRQDERVDQACLVADGMVARFAQTVSGERQIVALHIAGDMADLHSVVAPRSALPLQALSATTAVRIPHRALRELCVRYPALAFAFWRDAIADAGITAQSMLRLGRRRALPRLAHLLCEVGVRYEQIGCSRARFPLAARQVHLADALGLTPVHVNRTLRQLREQGLAELGGGEAHVADWDRLASVAEFDSNYLQLEPLDLRG